MSGYWSEEGRDGGEEGGRGGRERMNKCMRGRDPNWKMTTVLCHAMSYMYLFVEV